MGIKAVSNKREETGIFNEDQIPSGYETTDLFSQHPAGLTDQFRSEL